MVRARGKKQRISWARIALIVMVLLWIALAAAWWSLRSRSASPAPVVRGSVHAGDTPAHASPSSTPPALAQDGAAQAKGGLRIRKPARDAQLGVSAEAPVLLRIVEMYQWHERCELSGGSCSYEASWSQGHVDSGRFRVPAGHQNPPLPFADARFVAGEIRLGEYIVDPKLFDGRATQDFPVREGALPPNLAATFSVIDGALYAGGDASHPQIGTVRVRYRVVPAGETELSGVKRGNRLEPK